MPSSNDKFRKAHLQRLGIAVAEPEAPKPEPGTMNAEWADRLARSAKRVADAQKREDEKNQRKEEKRANAQTATGGTNLDAETIKAKEAYEAERRAPKNAAAALPTFDAIMAVVEKFLNTPEGRSIFRSEDNYESICNLLVKRLFLGEIELTLKATADTVTYLLHNGFLEFAPGESFDPETGGTVRKRGDVTRPASRVYPRFFHPSHAIADQLVNMYEAQQRWREETEQLRKDLDTDKLSFEDLQKSVRKNFKKGVVL